MLCHAQQSDDYCVPQRFGNQYIFAEEDVLVQSDIEYALSQNIDGDFEPQLMDIYTTAPGVDTLSHRPLAVVLHGGGFKSGDKTDFLVVESMKALARSGYTAATFNYRLGYDEPDGPCSADPDDIHRAAYRALQDCHAAMRFLFHHSDTYGIDTTYAFLGGVSAGGTLASLLHYGTPEYFWEHFQFLPLELGPIHTSGNSLEDEFSIDGLIMAWGSFPPFLDINEENALPVVAYHGVNDDVVPIGDGTFGECPEYPLTVGPDVYIPATQNAGACYDYNRSPDGGHNLDMYGQFYIKNRTICFLKSLMCESCVPSQQEQGSATCPTLGLSVNEFEDISANFSINPNPVTTNQLCYLSEMGRDLVGDMRIIDAQGKVVWTKGSRMILDGVNCIPDLTLGSGLYSLVIVTEDQGSAVLRFIND